MSSKGHIEPFTGVGLGLRNPHYDAVALGNPGVPFWEIAPENVLGEGGREHDTVCAILARDPVVTHGLGLSVGGFDPFDDEYLEQLAEFLAFTRSPWHSEHLCFSSVDGSTTHELLPMPMTRAAVRHTVRRARELRERLPVPFLLENITYYAELGETELAEPEFLGEILDGADVGWLLDINNVYVNALNFGFDPRDWLLRTPLDRVVQMHIAGHERWGGLTLDTHGAPVIDPVLRLMQWVLPRIGRPVPVLLERDNDIPSLETLLAERAVIQEAYDAVLAPAERPMHEASVLALQRSLVEAALMPDPGPLERDPAGFAAGRGLSPGDQAAFLRFKDQLLVYRHLIRGNLAEPVESTCCVTRALLEQAGQWEDCLAAFLDSRGAQSLFYRDLSATFLGWLAATGWGLDRWPFLLQLAHCELLSALVARHPGGEAPPGLHPRPRLGDRLVLDAPTQVVTYQYQVHLASRLAPIPAPGTVHLMAYRDAQGQARWLELTPATAALVLNAQQAGIGQAALELGLEDLSEAVELLADFQARGAIRGFAE